LIVLFRIIITKSIVIFFFVFLRIFRSFLARTFLLYFFTLAVTVDFNLANLKHFLFFIFISIYMRLREILTLFNTNSFLFLFLSILLISSVYWLFTSLSFCLKKIVLKNFLFLQSLIHFLLKILKTLRFSYRTIWYVWNLTILQNI
jgi:hypothetical protein